MNRLPLWVAGLALCLGGCVTTSQEERVRDYNQDGVFLFQRGDYVGARDCFNAALVRQPNDPNLVYNVGECYDRLGDNARAECLYRECLTRDSKHAACRHALIDLLTRTGRQTEAVTLIDTWLREQPVTADAYTEQGWYLHHTGDLPRAQASLHRALEIDPHNRRALTELALVYEALNRPDRSLVLYERILERDPNQLDISNRVQFLLAKGAGRPHPD
jgi:tetratricopeptide (TPR) repeat protein